MAVCSVLVFPRDISGLAKAEKIIDSFGTEDWHGHKGDVQEMLSSVGTQNVGILKKYLS